MRNITYKNHSYLKLCSIIVKKYKNIIYFKENNNITIEKLKNNPNNNVINDPIYINFNKEIYISKYIDILKRHNFFM